jgi:hypothetical protein
MTTKITDFLSMARAMIRTDDHGRHYKLNVLCERRYCTADAEANAWLDKTDKLLRDTYGINLDDVHPVAIEKAIKNKEAPSAFVDEWAAECDLTPIHTGGLLL